MSGVGFQIALEIRLRAGAEFFEILQGKCLVGAEFRVEFEKRGELLRRELPMNWQAAERDRPL